MTDGAKPKPKPTPMLVGKAYDPRDLPEGNLEDQLKIFGCNSLDEFAAKIASAAAKTRIVPRE